MCPRVLEPSSAVEDGLESLVGDVVHLLLGDRRSAGSCVLEAEQPQPPLGEGGEVAGDGGQGGHGDVWRRGRPGSDWGVLTPGPATPRPAPPRPVTRHRPAVTPEQLRADLATSASAAVDTE